MLVEKDSLMIYLLEKLYDFVLRANGEKGDDYLKDYVKGYIKGFKDCIEEVNKYQEKINKKGGI